MVRPEDNLVLIRQLLSGDVTIPGDLTVDGHVGISRAPTATHMLILTETFTNNDTTIVGIGNFPTYAPAIAGVNVGYAIQGNIWFDTQNWNAGSAITALQFLPAPNANNIGSASLDLTGIITGGLINIAGRVVTAADINGIVVTPLANIFGGTDSTTADNVRGMIIPSACPTDGVWGVLEGLKIEPQTSGVINRGLFLSGDGVGADMVFGAAADVRTYYDGADFFLITDLVAPSDFKLDCGTQKTLELVEEVWEDVRVSALSAKIGVSKPPAWSQMADDGAVSTGVYTYFFPDSAEKQIFFTIQMPHSYSEGTDLECHVHWAPQTVNGGQIDWFLEYTIANIDGIFGNTNTITMSDTGDGTINKHQITLSTNVSGAGLSISHMLVCRLYRDGGQGADTFVGAAAFLEFDIHFEKNTMGSRQELIK